MSDSLLNLAKAYSIHKELDTYLKKEKDGFKKKLKASNKKALKADGVEIKITTSNRLTHEEELIYFLKQEGLNHMIETKEVINKKMLNDALKNNLINQSQIDQYYTEVESLSVSGPMTKQFKNVDAKNWIEKNFE